MDRDDELKLKFSALHILLFLKKTSLKKKKCPTSAVAKQLLFTH